MTVKIKDIVPGLVFNARRVTVPKLVSFDRAGEKIDAHTMHFAPRWKNGRGGRMIGDVDVRVRREADLADEAGWQTGKLSHVIVETTVAPAVAGRTATFAVCSYVTTASGRDEMVAEAQAFLPDLISEIFGQFASLDDVTDETISKSFLAKVSTVDAEVAAAVSQINALFDSCTAKCSLLHPRSVNSQVNLALSGEEIEKLDAAMPALSAALDAITTDEAVRSAFAKFASATQRALEKRLSKETVRRKKATDDARIVPIA